MADVLISEFMDNGVAEALIAEFDTHWDPDLWSKREELKEQIASARAIVVRNGTLVNEELLDVAPNLKVVARMGVGLDTIDVEACRARGIEVCPSIGANAVSVAEHTMLFTLYLAKRMKAYDAAARASDFGFRNSPIAIDIADKVMTIVGFGRIGTRLAKRAREAFEAHFSEEVLRGQMRRALADAGARAPR